MDQPTAIRPNVIRRPWWALWSNPIFRRYCRSRLRPAGFGIQALLTVMVAGFFLALAYAFHRSEAVSLQLAARGPILPLLGFQALIVFLIGTAQASGGMTAERDESVIDYQRLIPMSPLAKVLGYLFGLPVREHVLFLITLPFMAWCLWFGKVSWHHWLPLYAAFFSSAMVYHLTGLVTGTVVRNRRWAFLASIGLVFVLYTAIPQLAKLGLEVFKYLTPVPVIMEKAPNLLPVEIEEVPWQVARVRFFQLDFSQLQFTLIAQGGLILVFLVMLCRKWRRNESHLLGKGLALASFLWTQTLFLGNALPQVEKGALFLSRQFQQYLPPDVAEMLWKPKLEEAHLLISIYGLVTLGLMLVFAGMITPSPERQFQGWRRARKLGHKHVPLFADAGSGWGVTLAMAALGGAGWFLFARGVLESHWFPETKLPPGLPVYYCLLLAAVGLSWQALLEARGAKTTYVTGILIGVLPLMAGSVLFVFLGKYLNAGIWVLAVSPLTLPFYASSLIAPADPIPIYGTISQAFHVWLSVMTLAAAVLALGLYARRRAIAAATRPGAPPPLPKTENTPIP